jgi:hypothetical protein
MKSRDIKMKTTEVFYAHYGNRYDTSKEVVLSNQQAPIAIRGIVKEFVEKEAYDLLSKELTKAKQDLADAVGLLISYRNMAGVERRSELEKFLSQLKGSE